jgi:hypothetical protein
LIKTRKDVLSHLGIEHAFLTGHRNEFCTILELGTEKRWVVAVGAPWDEYEAILNVKYRGAYLTWPVQVERKDAFSYWVSFNYPEGAETKRLWADIKKLEDDETLWNTRKEERFTVGADRFAALGLKKAEQRVMVAGTEFPCMIHDVSLKGAKLTTYDHGSAKRGDEITVFLDFISPIERITLKGTIQAMTVKTGEQRTAGGHPIRFAVISIQFSTDAPLAFRQRLGVFSEKEQS